MPPTAIPGRQLRMMPGLNVEAESDDSEEKCRICPIEYVVLVNDRFTQTQRL